MIYDNAPQHLQNFMPNNSRGVDYYPIRNPRWQPPMHAHTFITGTCRYQLPMILNDLNSNDIMSEVIKSINNVSLLGFKELSKHFCWIGIHLHVVFQIAMSVDRHIGL